MTSTMHEFASQGQRIYRQKILRSACGRKKGFYAAIEVKSGEYFVGRKPIEAVEKAEEKFPKNKFYIVRIGYRTATTLKTSQ